MTGKIWSYIYLVLAAAMWGGMFVVSKQTLNFLSPFVLLWFRLLVGLIFLIPPFLLKRERVSLKDSFIMVGLGFSGYFISYGSAFLGTKLSTAHLASLISASAPIFTIILAYWFLKETLTTKKILSITLATLGVLLVIGFEKGGQGTSLLGNIMLIISALSWGIYNVFVKKVASKYSSLTITVYTTGFAFAMMTPVMLVTWNHQDSIYLQQLNTWLSIVYLGLFGTAIAFVLWNRGMESLEASVGSMFYFFTPVTGSLFGWLILGENLFWNFYLGGIIIFLGTLVAITPQRKNFSKIAKAPSI